MSKDISLNWVIGIAGVAEVMTGLSKVAQSAAKVSDETGKLVETQKKLEKLDKTQENFKKISREYITAATNLQKLKEEYCRSGQGNAEFAKKVKEAEKYVEKLNKQKERQKHIFRAARSELEKEGIALKDYKGKLTEVNEKLNKHEELKKKLSKLKNLSETGDKFSQKGQEQISGGLKLGAVFLAPVKLYADLEESQADLKKMIDFRDKAEEEAYFEKIRTLSENSPLKQTEVYEIAGAAAQAGVAKEDIIEFTDRAMKLKVAFDMSTEASGEFIAKSKEQLGLTQQQTFAFADTINYMADNTAAKASQLVEISNRVGGVARTAKVSKEANIALGATLLSMGTGAEVASTGLKQLYLELSKGGDTKKKAIAFEFLGFDPKTINEDIAKDAEGTIVRVLEKINQLKDADKTAVLNDLFGEQAINSVSTLALNIDKVKDNLAKAHSEMTNGSVDKEYANRMNTLTNIFKQDFNQMINILADIGKNLAPEIKEFLTSIKGTLQGVANFVKENPKLVASIMKLVGGFALFNLTLGGVNKFGFANFIKLGGAIQKFFAFKKVYGLTGAFQKMFPLSSKLFGFLFKSGKFLTKGILNIGKLAGKFLLGGLSKLIGIIKAVGLAVKAAFVANPIGLIIVAIIAAIAIFVTLYKKVEWFRDGVNVILDGLKTYFSGVWNIIQGIFTGNFDLIKQGFAKMIEGVKKIFDGLTGIVKNTWNSIKGLFTDTDEKTEKIKNSAVKSAEVQKNTEKIIPKKTVIRNQDKVRKSGVKSRKISENWMGTNNFSGGLTTVAERGPELIMSKNYSYYAAVPSLMNLDKGTRILNSSDTRKTLSDRVKQLKNNLTSIRNSTTNNTNTTANSNYTINIVCNGNNTNDIAREVEKVLKNIENKKKRTVIA